MGFTTGFVGGLTLTYTLAYLSLYVHRQNRVYQSTLLTQQKALLTTLYEPPTEVYDEPAYEIRPAGLSEQLKDRWNRELETAVRNLQEKNWEETRLRWEKRLGNVWGRVKESEAGEQAQAAGEQVMAGMGDAKEKAEEALRDARAKAEEALHDARVKAEEAMKEAQSRAGQLARDAGKRTQEFARDASKRTQEMARDARDKTQELARDARDKAVEVKDQVVGKAEELSRDATVTAKEVTGQKRLLEL